MKEAKEIDIEEDSNDKGATDRLCIAVLGGGSFGTAMANLAACKGTDTTLWVRDASAADVINATHYNPRYLPDFQLDPRLKALSSLQQAVTGKDIVFVAVPSHSFRKVLIDMRPFISGQTVVSLTKGIEPDTYKTMSQLIQEELPQVAFGVVSGPNLAAELLSGVASGTVIASESPALRSAVYHALGSPVFRVFANSDVEGVEWAGALKNIYAVVMGVASNFAIGENTRSLIITRALAEMTRFATAMDSNPMTFMGLAGIGDLMATCSSPKSRNYQVGCKVGQGLPLDAAIKALGQTAEGVNTIKQVKKIADARHIDMPLLQLAYEILFNGVSPLQAAMQMLKGRGQRSDVEFVLPNN